MNKQCPKCNIWNSEAAIRCDCGYDFITERMQKSYTPQEIPPMLWESIIIFFIYSVVFSMIRLVTNTKIQISTIDLIIPAMLLPVILFYIGFRETILNKYDKKHIAYVFIAMYQVQIIINAIYFSKYDNMSIVLRIIMVPIIPILYYFIVNRQEIARRIIMIIGFPVMYFIFSDQSMRLYCSQKEIEEE